MAIPSRTRLQRYFAELQKIEEHRSLNAEKQIQKLYKEMLTNLQGFIGVEYAKYAEDDKLTYATLAKKGEYARFLEEVQAKVNYISPKVNKAITETVKDVYKLAYEGMVNAVAKSVNDKELEKLLSGIHLTPAQVIKAAVNNPVNKLTLSKTLEKNRKQIVHNIKQTVTVGIMNGDSMPTMANKIKNDVDQNYRKAMLIARTEVHRVRETGHNDSSQALDKKLAEADYKYRMVKEWRSKQDNATRHTKLANHIEMHGKVVLQDEDFDLGNGVTAPCPGQSGKAYHDCNCRCRISRDLWSDEEFFKATGKHFPKAEASEPEKQPEKVEEKPKKQYVTKKKLEQDIQNNQKQIDELKKKQHDEHGGYEQEIDELQKQIDEWQELVDKKVKTAQKKALTKQSNDLNSKISEFDVKTYSGIWKDDVTTADWKYKKSAIPKKKAYFEDKLQYATDDESAKWQKLLDDLNDFDTHGAEYDALETKLKQITADLTKLQNNGKIKSAAANAYTQERKDNALWFDSAHGGFSAADKYFDPPALEIHKSATKAENKGFYTYTSGSGGHNRPLAGFRKPWNKSGTGWEEEFYVGAKNVWIDFEGKGDDIRGLTTLIERSTYDNDVWLQSGQGFATLEGFLNIPYGSVSTMSEADLQKFVGRENTIFNFISTAVNEGGGSIFNKKPMKFNIYAPKGSQMLYASSKGAFGKGENEMILQRGGSYTITKIYWGIDTTDGNAKKLFVDLELHPEKGYDLFQQDPNEWTGSTANYHD